MGGSAGKGGSQTTRVELDPRLEEGAAQAIAAAFNSAALPYTPNRGVQIAGFAPQELAAMRGANSAAAAMGFGSPAMGSYLPAPTQTAGGFYGYSPASAYDEMMAQSVSAENAAQRDALLKSYTAAAKAVMGGGTSGSPYSTATGAGTNDEHDKDTLDKQIVGSMPLAYEGGMPENSFGGGK